jgi:hypothetical protein
MQKESVMKASMGTKQYAIVGLALATAVIHLLLGFGSEELFFQITFILNGVGYIVLAVALYFVPQLAAQRSLIRYALLAFTAVTFILYFAFNWPEIWSPMGLVDKAIELALIVLLWLDRE